MLRQLFVICVLVVAADGCQPSPTTVSGTVTLDGKPLSMDSDARGTIVFQPVGGQGAIATGLMDRNGHFQMATGASMEVLPGKYYVSISLVRLLPKSEQTEQGAERISPAKYASVRDSGLEADVAPGENELNFDLTSSADDTSSESPASPEPQPESTANEAIETQLPPNTTH